MIEAYNDCSLNKEKSFDYSFQSRCAASLMDLVLDLESKYKYTMIGILPVQICTLLRTWLRQRARKRGRLNARTNYSDGWKQVRKRLTWDERGFGSRPDVRSAGLFYSLPNYLKHPMAVKLRGRKAERIWSGRWNAFSADKYSSRPQRISMEHRLFRTWLSGKPHCGPSGSTPAAP